MRDETSQSSERMGGKREVGDVEVEFQQGCSFWNQLTEAVGQIAT